MTLKFICLHDVVPVDEREKKAAQARSNAFLTSACGDGSPIRQKSEFCRV